MTENSKPINHKINQSQKIPLIQPINHRKFHLSSYLFMENSAKQTCTPELGEELAPADVGEHHVEEAAVLVHPAQVHQERVVDFLINQEIGDLKESLSLFCN